MIAKIKSFLSVILAVSMIGNSLQCLGQGNNWASIKVGAAKVDVTPSADKLPANYEGIYDRIYSRAIVIDNGISSAALVSVDIGMMSDQIWTNLSKRVEKELGIPLKNVMLTATHTHSVPWVMGEGFEDKVFTSVRLAKENLQPACFTYGTGVSYINVNRNIIDPRDQTMVGGPEL